MIIPNKKYYIDRVRMIWIIQLRHENFYTLTQLFNNAGQDKVDINKDDLLYLMESWEVKPLSNLEIALYKSEGILNDL